MFPITWGGVWDYPYPEAQALIRGMRDLFGASRLVWGSDMPNVERFCTYKQCVDYVRRHCEFLTASEKERILGANVAELMGLPIPMSGARVGIDIGGTFTDLVFLAPGGRILRSKVLSTPDDYGQGIVNGLESGAADDGVRGSRVSQIVHGTTVATNAVLEGKGARVALITTEGFRDVLEIRRLRMPVLYDIRFRKPPALVPRRLRFEVPERIDHAGRVVRPLDVDAARATIDAILAERVDAIAICLINAYASGVHERALQGLIRERDAAISRSRCRARSCPRSANTSAPARRSSTRTCCRSCAAISRVCSSSCAVATSSRR